MVCRQLAALCPHLLVPEGLGLGIGAHLPTSFYLDRSLKARLQVLPHSQALAAGLQNVDLGCTTRP